MSAVAENIHTEMPAPILFTDSAAAKVADLIAEEGNPELKLRVFVQGGGCSGFQCNELPVFGGCRDRLQRRSARRSVRH